MVQLIGGLWRLRRDVIRHVLSAARTLGGQRHLEGIDAGQAGRMEDLELPIEVSVSGCRRVGQHRMSCSLPQQRFQDGPDRQYERRCRRDARSVPPGPGARDRCPEKIGQLADHGAL